MKNSELIIDVYFPEGPPVEVKGTSDTVFYFVLNVIPGQTLAGCSFSANDSVMSVSIYSPLYHYCSIYTFQPGEYYVIISAQIIDEHGTSTDYSCSIKVLVTDFI